MKALTCEMCGSTNLIKIEGVFVCQACGTKYSVEDARKMMVEGTVEIAGAVKVDKSDDLANLYEVARRAKGTDNREQAEKYYDQILALDPNSWEACFYTVYFKSWSCKVREIHTAANNVTNTLSSVISLIEQNVPKEEVKSVIQEVNDKLQYLATMLAKGAENHFYAHNGAGNPLAYNFYVKMAAVSRMVLTFADLVDKIWGEELSSISINAWKAGIGYQNRYIAWVKDPKSVAKQMESNAKKIRKYAPSYQLPKLNKRGCYVATAVYGSYDCPEVWTLRRYRDYILAETWYGRAFIRTYYAISPTLVKWFGDKSWFKNTCKNRLDKIVHKLQSDGIASSPYNDRVW